MEMTTRHRSHQTQTARTMMNQVAIMAEINRSHPLVDLEVVDHQILVEERDLVVGRDHRLKEGRVVLYL